MRYGDTRSSESKDQLEAVSEGQGNECRRYADGGALKLLKNSQRLVSALNSRHNEK